MMGRGLLLSITAFTLTGCVAHAAYDVATVPVRATSKVVDWTTTSRSEADRNRGRKLRKECKKEREQARREARANPGAPPPALPGVCR
jgi:hypothetical protein